MCELDNKKDWAPKNWWLWTMVLEKTLESSLDCKEFQPVHPQGNQLEGLMLKLKLQSFGHLMWRTDSFEKTLMLGKIEGGTRRDDRGWDGWMASLTQWPWFEQAPGDDEEQGSLAYCSLWGRKELDMTELLNWTESHISINITPLVKSVRTADVAPQRTRSVLWGQSCQTQPVWVSSVSLMVTKGRFKEIGETQAKHGRVWLCRRVGKTH